MVTSSATAIRPVEQPTVSRLRALLLLDPLLILAALGLVACSLVTLHGATRSSSSVDRQAIYAAVGLLVSMVLAITDYSRLREYKYVLYGTMIVLNVLVLGTSPINGARRWIPLPLFEFQSSEFGKVLLIVSLGAFVVDRARRLNEIRTTARIMLLAVLPALIVIPQPDLGTSMVYVAIGFTVLFVAGTSWKHLAALLAIAGIAVAIVVGGPAFGVHVLKPYQQQRLTGFLNPSHDPRNQTYNITESLIAIGSGEKSGRGTAGATQTELNYLPAPTTDFVFAALGETYGFVGAALVLSLYALLIWRALRILMIAKNMYGTLIAGGILAMLMFQVFVNVGMTIGIMPITGVPLPLMSYGGSSVLVTFIAVGLLQSIYVQGRKASAAKKPGFIG
jgi:rod shape determining protein RodA